MPGFNVAIFSTIYQVIGLPAALLLIYWIAIKWMRSQEQKTNADRKEHSNKWDSMVKSFDINTKRIVEAHTNENNRMFALHERQTSLSEMHTAELSRLTERVGDVKQDVNNIKDKLEDHILEMRTQNEG